MFKKILFPVSGEILSDEDLAILIDVASKYNSEIFLLTVSEIYHTGLSDLNVPEDLFVQHENLLKEYLRKYEERFKKYDFVIHKAIKNGTAYQEILDYAEEIGAELIIIPTHGRTGLPSFILGSVALKVVKMAKCPVLTFKPNFKEDF
jgi:nucleotide-binding universal stress UspA family protein